MELSRVVQTWASVRATRSRKNKSAALAACLLEAGDTLAVVAAWLSGAMPQGRIGVGYSTLSTVKAAAETAPGRSTLTVHEVHDSFTTIAGVSGKGSKARRLEFVEGLYGRATYPERIFLIELLSGELRQGAQEGVLLDAVAIASGLDTTSVRRAFMLCGQMAEVAVTAIHHGHEGLDAFHVELFRPLRPMLAQPADNAAKAMVLAGNDAFVDRKLDGVRLQIHKDDEEVRVYTRHLHDVTGMVPEVAQAARDLEFDQFVLDAEAIALHPDGTPKPFQVTMKRFGRSTDIAEMRVAIPLSTVVFDALMLNGEECIDWPAHKRFEALRALPERHCIERSRVTSVAEAEAFFASALEDGHEGIMVKDPNAPYAAGARGRAWMKVKPSHSLDLVVIAAEWGSGRRKGWLSNLHLAARDDETGEPVMLGKTFKGLTDELLAWQTEALEAIATDRTKWAVRVRPELVVEVAFNDVQVSQQYPGGVALRFARVRRYRPDKTFATADTLSTVQALLPSQ